MLHKVVEFVKIKCYVYIKKTLSMPKGPVSFIPCKKALLYVSAN
jgi:hypothetical protein